MSYTETSTTVMPTTRKGPFKLVTVNTAPERAKRLIGRMIENLKDEYDIEYVANCESMPCPVALYLAYT